MKLAIVSFGHADVILHYAKTLSEYYDIDLIFVFAMNKRLESVLNFENEHLHTGFLEEGKVERILGKPIQKFIDNKFRVKFFINYNLKIRSIKNIQLAKQFVKVLNKYDIVHFSGMDATLILYNYFLKHNRKVFTIHDVKLHSGEKGRKYINIPENFNQWLINSKYQVIIQNKPDYEEIIKKHPGKKFKINLIPFKVLNIYKYFLNTGLSYEKSDVLFFGRISPYKGLRYLIDALDIVKKNHPDVRVMIAGGGDIENDIPKEKMNKNLIIKNRYISSEDLAGIISNTRIVVCPYTDATQSAVVMTSFAFGKPVIASAVGGFPDVIENGVTGRLIPPRDVKMLADSIINLLSDENKINEMSENIKERCDNGYLSWASIIQDAKKVYDEILQNGKMN